MLLQSAWNRRVNKWVSIPRGKKNAYWRWRANSNKSLAQWAGTAILLKKMCPRVHRNPVK